MEDTGRAGSPATPPLSGIQESPSRAATGAAAPVSAPQIEVPVGFDEGVSFLEFVNVLLRHWRVVAGLPIGAASLTVLVSFAIAPTYRATTTFLPETPGGGVPAGLAGLASQFGLSVGAEANQSPSFYADVLTSRELMQKVLLDRYPDLAADGATAASATLLQILDRGGDDHADSLQRGIRRLTRLVSANVDNRTSIVRLSVEGRDPALSALVANRFVHYLNEFNARTRQSQARERRTFAEDRLAEAERELRGAEQDLRGFYERNRSWQQAPQLAFEEGRLRRQVDVRQEVYLTLKREYEKARIEEFNDIPVITVIDAAVPVKKKSKPRRVQMALLALVVGGLVGVVWAFGADQADRLRREADSDYRVFRGLVREFRADVRHLVLGQRRKRRSGTDRAGDSSD